MKKIQIKHASTKKTIKPTSKPSKIVKSFAGKPADMATGIKKISQSKVHKGMKGLMRNNLKEMSK
jgi:hypothetical protein